MRIVEVFDSIQGEGPLIGTLSTFVRTAGCNLRCPPCDTKYAWPDECRVWTFGDLQDLVHYNTHVVLTGGEPLLQPDVLLALSAMCPATITVETNGTLDIPEEVHGEYIHWSVSPKLPWFYGDYEIDRDALFRMSGTGGKTWFKFVVRNRDDIQDALDFARHYAFFSDTVVLQPPNPGRYVDDSVAQYLKHLALLVEQAQSLATFPGIVRILPQLHTLLWPGEPGR